MSVLLLLLHENVSMLLLCMLLLLNQVLVLEMHLVLLEGLLHV